MTDENTKYANLNIKETGRAELEINGEIPFEILNSYRKKALKVMGEKTDIPGFRKGRAPEDVLIKRFGEMAVLEEAVELAMHEIYPEIIKNQNIKPIGRPSIRITKLAPGIHAAFSIKTALAPKVILPDYKMAALKINKSDDEVVVEEREIEDALMQIRKALAPQNEEGGRANLDKEPPELTDEMVKKIGDFGGIEGLRNKLREGILQEKQLKAKEKKRAELGEELIKTSKITMPDVLILGELEYLFAQFKADIETHEMKFEDYLNRVKKSEDAIRAEMRPIAEKKAKLQLILNEIAMKDNIKPNPEELERSIKIILEKNKNADPETVRIHISTILRNEAVFNFLENF